MGILVLPRKGFSEVIQAGSLGQNLFCAYPTSEGGGTVLRESRSRYPLTGTFSWLDTARGRVPNFSGSSQNATNSSAATDIVGLNQFSLAIWCRTTAAAHTADLFCLGASATNQRLSVVNTGRVTGTTQTTSGGSTGQVVFSIFDGQWHLLVLTYASGARNIYVDGTVRSSSASATGVTTHNNNALTIGSNGSGTNLFTGQLACPLLWTRAITPSEVQQLWLDPYALWTIPKHNLWTRATDTAAPVVVYGFIGR
jgi:hypothetical protein